MNGSRSGLPPTLRMFLLTCAMLSCASITFFAWMWRAYPGPLHGMPMVATNPWLTDLLTTIRIMPIVHQPEFFTPEYGWIYPAPCIFLYELLLRPGLWLHHWKIFGYAIYLSIVILGLVVVGIMLVRGMVSSAMERRTAAIFVTLSTLLSWPIWLGIHQGNIEMVLWFGTAAGAWLIFRRRWMAAAVLIGFVYSFKLYPVLLLGMLLLARKYKEIAVSFVVFLVITLLAMQYIGPSIPVVWHRIAPGIASFKDLGFYPGYVERQFLCFDHALIALIRVLTSDDARLMVVLGKIWIPLFAVLGSVVFFLRIAHMPRINQLLFLILAILLLPPKSYDYTIEMLYLPWAAMVLLAIRRAREGVRVPGLTAMLVCMAVAFSPMFFLQWHGIFFFGQATCAVLLVLTLLCCRYPLADDRLPATPANP